MHILHNISGIRTIHIIASWQSQDSCNNLNSCLTQNFPFSQSPLSNTQEVFCVLLKNLLIFSWMWISQVFVSSKGVHMRQKSVTISNPHFTIMESYTSRIMNICNTSYSWLKSTVITMWNLYTGTIKPKICITSFDNDQCEHLGINFINLFEVSPIVIWRSLRSLING